MRTALVLAAALAGCSSADHADLRYITIGSDAIATAQQVAADRHAAMTVVETAGDVAILQVDASELDALAEQMHEQHGRCGGFILHDSLAEAEAQLQVADGRPGPDYRLDRGPAVGEVLPALDARAILGTIGELSGMKNRYYRSDMGAAASVWLQQRWQSFTTRPDVTVELFDQGYPQKSVIMTIPGSTRPDEVVVIGGHLDSIARGGSAAVAPGADDDASGVSTLTEVARVLLAKNFRPARTVMFMAYAAEEVGLRGSQAIVRDFKKRGVNVVGALQLDMTNYQGSDKDIWIIDDYTSVAQNDFLVKLIETYVGATYGHDKCGYACSDHAAWHRAGVPASMPFEARFRQSNHKIHTDADTLEMSGNNAAHAVKFAKLAAAYAIELGKGELGPPATITASTDRDTGDGGHRTAYILAVLGLAALLGLHRRFG